MATIISDDSTDNTRAQITWEISNRFVGLTTTDQDIKLLIDMAAGIHYAMFRSYDDPQWRDQGVLTYEMVAILATCN